MIITKEFAKQMESCIKQTHIDVTRQYQGQMFEIAGGTACFSGFDSFFSQVVGWGFNSKREEWPGELDQIESFYLTLNHSRVDIELCPFTGTELAEYLSQRGYLLTELNNVSVLDLKRYQSKIIWDNAYLIGEVLPDQFTFWADQVAAGFGYPEAKEQFCHYLQTPGVTAFAVYFKGQIIAGATVAIHGDMCDLGVTSTLPAYRCRGLQQKLLAVRLDFAKKQGVQCATVTTEPGTVSDRNIQKSGFHCAYTRVKMTLDRS